jgi:hypothetical protein
MPDTRSGREGSYKPRESNSCKPKLRSVNRDACDFKLLVNLDPTSNPDGTQIPILNPATLGPDFKSVSRDGQTADRTTLDLTLNPREPRR